MSVELNDYDAVAVNLKDGGVKFIIVMDGARDPILADVASELVKYSSKNRCEDESDILKPAKPAVKNSFF